MLTSLFYFLTNIKQKTCRNTARFFDVARRGNDPRTS
jgi:hypothetical protein